MLPRLRLASRSWPTSVRAYSSKPYELPSPLQRELFRRVAQPVAVISTHIPASITAGGATHEIGGASAPPPGHNHGATLSSLASVSLSPPLVSFSLRLPSRLASHLSSTPAPSFRVHLLSPSQEAVARAFARQPPLPAPATPSPPPSSSTTTDWNAPFPSELFEQLETGGIGWMDCTVVQRIALSELGEEEEVRAAKSGGERQPRSELFIARVGEIKLGGEDAGGSLVYWEQEYHAVSEEGQSR